jgi:hypothetical protein
MPRRIDLQLVSKFGRSVHPKIPRIAHFLSIRPAPLRLDRERFVAERTTFLPPLSLAFRRDNEARHCPDFRSGRERGVHCIAPFSRPPEIFHSRGMIVALNYSKISSCHFMT